ncbi:MAG: peptidylprolyl isomerase [Xanthomonadales bacterium]|nr:peptidylprolyl isomerase [Xanthomonadales bacterium]
MKPILTLILLALAIAVAGTPNAQAQLLPSLQTQQLDRIVAVVNNSVILQSELDAAMQTVMQQYQGDSTQLPPKDILQHQVLARLILQRLQVERADDQGIRVPETAVDQSVAQVAQQNKISVNQLRAALTQQGADYSAFRHQLADQIKIRQLRRQTLQSHVQITDSEIDNLINSPTFSAGEVHLKHIVIGVPEGATPADVDAAKARASTVMDALKSGADFSATAIKYSDAPDALEGGDLSWHRVDELPQGYANLITTMHPGEVSPALRDPNGYNIVKMVARRAPAPTVETQYHALHLMISPTVLLSDDKAHQEIEDLRAKIVSGKADFASVAKKHSDDKTTANLGGDMDWFPLDGWGQAIGDHIKTMKDGEISQPFKAGDSWHIVKLLGERQQDRTKEVEREQARQAIGNRKSQEVYANFLRQLRSQAYIDIRLGKDKADSASS